MKRYSMRLTSATCSLSFTYASRGRYSRSCARLSALEDPTFAAKALDKLSEPERAGSRTYKGFNFFSDNNRALRLALPAPTRLNCAAHCARLLTADP